MRRGFGQCPEPESQGQAEQAESPEDPLDAAGQGENPGQHERRDEGAHPEEEVQAIDERPGVLAVNPQEQRVAAHVVGALNQSHHKLDQQEQPELARDRDEEAALP